MVRNGGFASALDMMVVFPMVFTLEYDVLHQPWLRGRHILRIMKCDSLYVAEREETHAAYCWCQKCVTLTGNKYKLGSRLALM